MRLQKTALTVDEYLELPESDYREELEFGWIVREPEANLFWHEGEVMWLAQLLYEHVQKPGLGRVFTGGNVILDDANALVVVPDVMVFLRDRLQYVRAQAVGPPNLVVEIASPGTQARDREKKVQWYRRYGVQECWLIDTRTREVRVFHLEDASTPDGLLFQGDAIVESRVLPDLQRTAASLLDPFLADPLVMTEEDEARSERMRVARKNRRAARRKETS